MLVRNSIGDVEDVVASVKRKRGVLGDQGLFQRLVPELARFGGIVESRQDLALERAQRW
jgi:hypothetical protein